LLKKLFLFLCIILFISLVSSLDLIQQNDCITINKICDNCTYMNLSSYTIQGNSTINILNINMTQNFNSNFNATFCYTSILGIYDIKYCGNPDNNFLCNDYFFKVNLTGSELSQSQGTLYIIMFFGLIIFFVLTVWGAIAIEWKNPRDDEDYIIGMNDFKYLKIVLWFFAYLEMLFLVYILSNLSLAFLENDGSYFFFNLVYNIMLILLVPFFPCLIAFTIIIWLSDQKTQKMLQRGIPTK
jgi:hypothetical protein